jgi:hypothetical protein
MKQKPVMMLKTAFCAALLLGIAGCATRALHNPDEAIQGTWKSDESVAVYRIGMADGKLTVDGYSSFSGKEMIIDDVSWDGTLLRFTSYMPSTDFKVVHENRLVDSGTMVSQTEGQDAHTVTWKKQKP